MIEHAIVHESVSGLVKKNNEKGLMTEDFVFRVLEDICSHVSFVNLDTSFIRKHLCLDRGKARRKQFGMGGGGQTFQGAHLPGAVT